MTHSGARGATASEMAGVLRLPADAGALHASIGQLMHRLGEERRGGETLRIANALWLQDGLPVLASFLALLREHYGAHPEIANFKQSAQACRVINAWVSERTAGKIEDLLQPGVHVTADTLLVLVNAIYFKGRWECEFEAEDTRPEPFRLAAGGEVSVPTMRMESEATKFGFLDAGTFKLLELPYAGSLSIVLALPRQPDGLPGLERALTAERLSGTIRAMLPWNIRMRIPKFRIEGAFSLKEVLCAMGMASAFGDSADFSGMTAERVLKIGAVVHKAFVDLNEQGTEAAAATAVVMDLIGAMHEEEDEPEWKTFRADHPFLFVIRDRSSEAIVFIGRVENPA
jgi:serpin B